ncbi:hypothetical protein JCM19239_668 [Vibrio variabilis]|uniref:Uncharacterized protein n=2 Tax=Vibrio TaxID=662 RepID=A0ABQ0JML5_9VIBR|nr:hypothetical protein JCM19239_668 [Vibrio variabilis]
MNHPHFLSTPIARQTQTKRQSTACPKELERIALVKQMQKQGGLDAHTPCR